MGFNATSKFRMRLLNEETGRTEQVSVQIGLDGLKLSDASSGRSMRSYKLGDISRWRAAPTSLVLHTRTPMDVEESQVTLQGDEHTTRSMLDVLTCSCMQLAELLQSKQSGNDQENETANSLHALVVGNGKKKSKLPAVEDVEYWHSAEKEGWMQSQGDYLSTWRKRWFVLKQGYLFRFMNSNVTESVKPRGVVDLSKIQDVKPASSIIGRPNSIQLKTAAGGTVAYICESETDMVLWLSMFQESIQRIIKLVAGVEDEPPAAANRANGGGSSSSKRSDPSAEWVHQLERNFDSMSATGGSRATSQLPRGAMVDVVGYESAGGGGGVSSSGRSGGGGGSSYGGDLGYGSIAGLAGVASNSGGLSADTMLNYGAVDGLAGVADGYGSYGGGSGGMPGSSGSYAHAAMPHAPNGGGYPYPQQSYSTAPAAGMPGPPLSSQAAPAVAAPLYAPHAAALQGYAAQQPAMAAAPAQAAGAAPSGSVASLIDAMPPQQPAYPYFQQGLPPAQAAVASAPAQQAWQVHYTGEGRPYYYNTSTGVTQWEAPPAS